jgi:broad specificity phosphatase PhoE
MSYAYHVDPDHGLVLVRPSGQFTDDELIEVFRRFLQHPDRDPDFDHVWDTSSLDELVVDVGVIDKYRSVLDEHAERVGDGRVAVVAHRETTRMLATMLFSLGNGQRQRTQRIFETLEQVADWLELPVSVLTGIPDDQWISS